MTNVLMMTALLSLILPARSDAPPLACNLGALTPAERKEHDALGQRMRSAVVRQEATTDGYAFHLDSARISIDELSRWIALEKRCCPFFTFAVNADPLVLRLGGGPGVREFIAAELPMPPAPHNALAETADLWVTRVEQEVVPSAEAMPEDKYTFAPTGGRFEGVRTFAGQVKHLAAANFQLAARVLGEKPPAGTQNETAPDSVRTKPEIMKYLKDSFAMLHKAAAAVDDGNISPVIDAIAHSSNHYGQMVEYLRMNGIVPPASR
jgi:hypothetical protein